MASMTAAYLAIGFDERTATTDPTPKQARVKVKQTAVA
jgi:hypothetical protein